MIDIILCSARYYPNNRQSSSSKQGKTGIAVGISTVIGKFKLGYLKMNGS